MLLVDGGLGACSESSIFKCLQVVSIEQSRPQQLRVLLTTNIGINVPPNANRKQLNDAIDVAQLYKDEGIGNLTWIHTTEALGARAVTEDSVKTYVREPDPRNRVKWEAIVLPIIAGTCLCVPVGVPCTSAQLSHIRLRARANIYGCFAGFVIIGSALMLKIRRSRENGPIEAVAQTPHLLISRVLTAFRTPMTTLFRDHSHMSDVSSDVGLDCDDLEVDVRSLRPTRAVGKRGSAQLTHEMSMWTSEDTRKRNEMSRDEL